MQLALYAVGISRRFKKPTITIYRKPSEIPWGIDRELMHMAGTVILDGPNNRVIYEFLIPGKIKEGEAFLKGCGWIRIETVSFASKER